MFPEYVENYNQQLLSEQAASEQHASSESRHDKSSRSVSETNLDSTREDIKKVEGLNGVRRNKKQPFPTWLMLLLFSIFGVVMALPLLQL
jgi:ubiquitin-conjugating enzyme E2 J2